MYPQAEEELGGGTGKQKGVREVMDDSNAFWFNHLPYLLLDPGIRREKMSLPSQLQRDWSLRTTGILVRRRATFLKPF